MDDKLIINETVEIEMNMANLYMLYYELFPEDKDFWWQLSNEEKNHASIILAAAEFIKFANIDEEFYYSNYKELRIINDAICEIIREFNQNKPSKYEACRAAYELESSAYELHFEKMMTGAGGSKYLDILRQLNGEDKEHANRVKKFMEG